MSHKSDNSDLGRIAQINDTEEIDNAGPNEEQSDMVEMRRELEHMRTRIAEMELMLGPSLPATVQPSQKPPRSPSISDSSVPTEAVRISLPPRSQHDSGRSSSPSRMRRYRRSYSPEGRVSYNPIFNSRDVVKNGIYNDESSDEIEIFEPSRNQANIQEIELRYAAALEEERLRLSEIERLLSRIRGTRRERKHEDRRVDKSEVYGTGSSGRELRDQQATWRSRELRRRQEIIAEEDKIKELEKEKLYLTCKGEFEAQLRLRKASFPREDEEPFDDRLSKPEQGPRPLVPELRHVSLEHFKASENRFSIKAVPIIEVLLGDPRHGMRHAAIPLGNFAKDGIESDPSSGFRVLQTPPRPFSKRIPGQDLLPERIRVLGPIIRFLRQRIDRPRLIMDDPRILVRPYRILVEFDDLIRDLWQAWANYFDIDSPRRMSRWNSPRLPLRLDADSLVGLMSASEVQHVECLLDFMDEYIKPKMDYLASPDCQKVAFADIWYLFKPGDFVIGDNDRQIYRVMSVASTSHRASMPYYDYLTTSSRSPDALETSIRILCIHIDFDGNRLGPITTEFSINKFEGEKALTSLEIRPGNLDRNPSQREKYIHRGKKFVRAAAVQHLHYAGIALETRDEIDSQVVIDFAECLSPSASESWKPWIESAVGVGAVPPSFESCMEPCCRSDYIYHDECVEEIRDEKFMSSLLPPTWTHSKLPSIAIYPRTLEEANTEENRIMEEEFLIMSYRVFGFVLNSRKWGKLISEFITQAVRLLKLGTTLTRPLIFRKARSGIYEVSGRHK